MIGWIGYDSKYALSIVLILMLRSLVFLLSTAVFLAACATSPTGRSQLMLVSPENAVKASATAYPEKLAKYKKREN